MPKKRSKVKKHKRSGRSAAATASRRPSPADRHESAEPQKAFQHSQGRYPYRRPTARLLTAAPMLLGAFAPGGFMLQDPVFFAAVFISVIAADACGRWMPSCERVSYKLLQVLAPAILFLALFSVFAVWSKDFAASGLYAGSLALSFLLPAVPATSVKRLLLLILASGVLSPMLAVLGVFTQAKVVDLRAVVLGIPPSLLFAGSIAARSARLFENAGWKRSRLAVDRKGNEVLRPLGIARLVTLLLFLGPAIPVGFALGGLAPNLYCLTGLLLLAAPSPAGAFLEGRDDTAAVEKLEQLSIASLLVLLVLGLL